jgi:thiol-disulfide isomerase/thioredoxin
MTIILGYEKKLELIVANNVFDVTKIEQHILRTQEENNIQEPSVEEKSIESVPSTTIDVEEKDVTMSKEKEEISVQTPGADERMSTKAKTYTRAPEITNPSGFVNTDGKPITLSEFKGKKVVLVDFWTYSCINCQRTIPYLKAWDEKYRDEGLVIVGVHTPEFAFEKVLKNVENSVNNTFDLKYPVVLDNEYNTWNAFGNRFWPRKYLIDIDGYIVYDHIGEGAYDITEKEIQKALKERSEVLNTDPVSSGIVNPSDVVKPESGKVGSPEVYFGSDRNDSLGNGTAGVKTFIVPQSISKNTLYLDGTWNRQSEYAESKAERVKIIYKYSAKDVYFVASSDAGATIKVSIDGKPAGAYAGSDVSGDGSATITENRLYKLIQDTEYGEHTLEIEVIDGTLQAYTFTFG